MLIMFISLDEVYLTLHENPGATICTQQSLAKHNMLIDAKKILNFHRKLFKVFVMFCG